MEVKAMGYNPQNAKEKEFLPVDSILDAEIVRIQDGVVRNFLQTTTGWKTDLDQPAIEVEMKIGEVKFSQIFTYSTENGQTTYTKNSNLGKFKKKYGQLPTVGVKVKVQTSADGFGKIKLD
jgi:hypothetical protein